MEELLIPVGQRLFYLQVSLASLFRNKKNKKPANLKALCPSFFVNKRQLSFDCPCSSINCLSRALTSQFSVPECKYSDGQAHMTLVYGPGSIKDFSFILISG
ncbi:hypothetical protein NC652_001304 [Populus alba x Populus x berolinensis]|nr:hypothetical protein NC652_001304 [Populus alba x Populus x berolinensis]